MRSPNNSVYSILISLFSVLYLSASIIRAQDIRAFPAGTSLGTPLSTNVADEQVYELTMTGATTTKVSRLFIIIGIILPSVSIKIELGLCVIIGFFRNLF